MTLSEHLKNEELERLSNAWKYLTPLQRKIFRQQPPAELQAWIMQDDPTIVNHLLTALCETIIITPMYELKIVWR